MHFTVKFSPKLTFLMEVFLNARIADLTPERSTWRSGVRSAMRAASQLPGKGPTDVDDAPAPARKSKIRL